MGLRPRAQTAARDTLRWSGWYTILLRAARSEETLRETRALQRAVCGAASFSAMLACCVAATRGPPATSSSPATCPVDQVVRIVYRDNFEAAGPLAGRWELYGQVTVACTPLRRTPGVGKGGRHGLVIDAREQSGLRCKPLPESVRFEQCEVLVLRVRAPRAGPRDPVGFEVRLYAPDHPGWRHTRIHLTDSDWRTLRIPLRRIRPARKFALAWSCIRQVGLHFSNAVRIELDSIELHDTRPGGPDLTPEEVRALAFAGHEARVRTLQADPFVVLSDAGVEPAALRRALDDLGRWMHDDLGGCEAVCDGPLYLLLFAEERTYKAFWPRLGREFGLRLPSPASAGFTYAGIAGAVCGDVGDAVRPVVIHEATHALLERMLGLAGNNDWVHEGLAARYQARFARQDLHAFVRRGIRDRTLRLRLDLLTNGGNIDDVYTWQAASVVEWILVDPHRRAGFRCALRAMAQRGSSALGPVVQPCFGRDLMQMSREWQAWAQRVSQQALATPETP